MDTLKIVLLTDFSPLSKVAMEYAIRMTSRIEAEFTILHAVRVDGVPKSNLRWRQIEKELMSIANEEGEKLLEELQAKTTAQITFKALRAHTVADMTKRYISRHYTNLVVMGSRGASQLKKVRFGGTTVSVIDSLYCPVMAIPDFARYRDFKHVVYATDLKNFNKELDLILPFAKIFGSHIHVVHVVPAIDKKTEALQKIVIQSVKQTDYNAIDFKLVIDDDVPGAIDLYIQEKKADLLATFTHELNLYEKLFGLSVTRKLAYQGNIPLLAFKRK